VVKTGPKSRLQKEAQALRLFQGCGFLRQLVNEIQHPPSLVLEYMDNAVLDLLNQNQLGWLEASVLSKQPPRHSSPCMTRTLCTQVTHSVHLIDSQVSLRASITG
jgi:hypothetical protein